MMIHLVANAETAFERIKDDPDADKFETLEYMQIQEEETRKGFERLVRKKDSALSHFFDSVNFMIDTTDLTTDETYEFALRRLGKIMEF